MTGIYSQRSSSDGDFFTTVVNETSGNQIYISGFSVNISFNNDDNSIARNARRRRKCDENKSIRKT